MMDTKLASRLATAMLCAGIAATTASAQSNWVGGTSADWNDATNWANNTVPVGGAGANDAIINVVGGGNPPFTAVISDTLAGDDANPRDIRVGNGAGNSGKLNHTSGRAVLGGGSGSGWAFIGAGGGTGEYNMSGDAYLQTGGRFIGSDGGASTSTITMTDSARIETAGEFWVGQGGGSTSTLTMSGNSVATAGEWIAVGRDNATGTVNLSGNARLAKVSGNNEAFITIGGLGNTGGGVININDNAVLESNTGLVIAESGGRTGTVNQMGGTVSVVNYASPQGFGKSLYIQYAATGTGTYNLSAGRINAETVDAVDGTFTMTGGELNAILWEGNLVQGGGTTTPDSAGRTTTVTGDYSLNAGSLLLDLDGLGAGVLHDQLAAANVTLAGALALDLGFTPAFGDTFLIVNNTGTNPVSGAFTQGGSITAGGTTFSINYAAGDGNDVVLTAVPEPATLALLALAGCGLWTVRRKR